MAEKINRDVLPGTREALLTVLAALRNLDEVDMEVAHHKAEGAIQLARAFVILKSGLDEIEERVKAYRELVTRVKEVDLPEAFEAAGVPTVKLDEGYRVTVARNVRASIKGEADKAEAYQWLRDNGFGDLVTNTVNASALSSLARSMAEENQELDSKLFNVAIMPTTSVTRTK